MVRWFAATSPWLGPNTRFEEDHEVRGHELVVLALGDAAKIERLHLLLALQAQQVLLGLHPLDLEGAVVADVGDLPEPVALGTPMMPTKNSTSMALEHLEVPVVPVRVAQRAHLLLRRTHGVARAPRVLDGVLEDVGGDAARRRLEDHALVPHALALHLGHPRAPPLRVRLEVLRSQ